MNDYKIEITETLSRIVTVSASSQRDAVGIVEGKYADQEIVLNAEDFKGVEIEVFE